MTEQTVDTTTNTDSEQPSHPFERGLELYEQKAPYAEVIALFEQGVTLTPKDSVGYTCLAWLHMLRNEGDDVPKAIGYAQRALRLDNSNFQAHFNLVMAMLMNGESGIRPEFQRAMSKLRLQEDRDEVVNNLKDALEREPGLEAAQKMLKWIEG